LTQVKLNYIPQSITASVQPIKITSVAQGAVVYSGTGLLQCVAGELIAKLKCVKGSADGKVFICPNTEANILIGIATNEAETDHAINIRINGLLSDESWTWLLDREIYCDANGDLTQVAPLSGYKRVVGTPISPTTMLVRIQQVI